MAVRLPWAGDLGIHAATLERLRHDMSDPGDPLVNADVTSPYYSPWMLFLAVLGKVTGLTTFQVLHVAAAINLVLLVTGVRQFVRTLTARKGAVAMSILCLALLCGWGLFTWSGFTGLTSLALCLAYPSSFALGVAFHLWALLRRALAADWGWVRYLALGVVLAVVLLSHQFTGVVTSLGLLAIALGRTPLPARAVWYKLGAGVALAVAILAVWPYYSFFGLLGVGGLNSVHKPLYEHLVSHYGLLALGVVALGLRFRRDQRDPLVLFFAMGAFVYFAGDVTGQYAYGRVLPAVFISAQLALGIEVAGESGPAVRRWLVPVTAAALLVGCWAQAGTLNYVAGRSAMPSAMRHVPSQKLWAGYGWIRKDVAWGDTIMTKDYFALRQAPAYGAYTVESGYPDFFLPDQTKRTKDTKLFFKKTTSRARKLSILREFHVKWVIAFPSDGGLSPHDPALERVARGPHGEVLYKVRST
ncbi:hypothetical protein CK485_19370 [Streptomyces sp. ICBB 8177]|nr:hypothetical protein CK485_19370 [Streptomyces sp. ICBB 8177]